MGIATVSKYGYLFEDKEIKVSARWDSGIIKGGSERRERANELHETYEEQYLFRDGSAAAWINSIENKIVSKSAQTDQPANNATVSNLKFGSEGKAAIDVLTFDFRKIITSSLNPTRQTILGIKIYSEQKELSLAKCTRNHLHTA